MKTSQEFIDEIKTKSGDQMTRDGKRIADMDDKELMKRMIERYPGERENIIDIDEYLGEEVTTLPDVPAKSAVQEQLDKVAKSPSFLSRVGNRIKETTGDVVETVQGVGSSVVDTAKDIYGIGTRDDINLAQKFAATSGRVASGAAGVVGELTIGAGKAFLPQEGEDLVKKLAEKVGTAVSETEAAKSAAEWYAGLDTADKVIVDSLGGIASLITEVIGLKGGTMAGKALKQGIEESAQAVAPVAVKVAGEVGDTLKLGKAVDTVVDVFTPSQKSLEAKVNQYFEKGVKPNLGTQITPAGQRKYQNDVVTGAKVITSNKKNLKFVDENGEVIAGQKPETLQQLADSIEQTKKVIFNQYDDLATKAGDAGVRVDTVRIANQLDDVINNKALQLSNPEAVSYAKDVRDRFLRSGSLDAKTAQDVIQNYNNSLQAFNRNPTPEGLTRNAVDAFMANQMRQALDEGIEGLTGANYQNLKNQYGALKTIERDVMRATLRDARKNVKGLIDYTDIFSGGQLVSGLLTLNPGMVASGAAQKSIASYFKFLNNPNRAVKKMFETAEELDQDAATIPMSTRKQLGAPEEGAANEVNNVPIKLGERSQSTIDELERNNPEIKTFAKGYFSKGTIPVEKIDSDGNISIEYAGNIYYPDPEDLPVIKFGNKPKSKKEKTDISIDD